MCSKLNETISKIKNGKLTIGGWLQIVDSSIAKIMSSCDFDWIALDLEHGKYNWKDLSSIFDIITANDCLPLARLADNDDVLIKLTLDAGANGVIVPMINSVKDAANAVAATKYPPKGVRGIGFSNASTYGKNFDDYFSNWNKRSIVIVQIEHIEGVNNLEEILAVDGVDGLIVGPYDLSGSMDLTGKFEQPNFKAAIKKITKIGLSSKKLLGIHIVQPDTEAVISKVQDGYNFIAYSLDSVVLWTHFCEAIERIRKKIK